MAPESVNWILIWFLFYIQCSRSFMNFIFIPFVYHTLLDISGTIVT